MGKWVKSKKVMGKKVMKRPAASSSSSKVISSSSSSSSCSCINDLRRKSTDYKTGDFYKKHNLDMEKLEWSTSVAASLASLVGTSRVTINAWCDCAGMCDP
jgi:hypothetical protein